MSFPARILLIGGDESTRGAIGGMLESENLVPILAGDAEAGLKQTIAAQPQLVVVDLHGPSTANADFCKRLRTARIHLPLIVLSSVGDELDKVLLLEIGADDYVVKPCSLRELLARIRALLRRAREWTAPKAT